MPPRPTAVASDTAIPDKVDVVIVGGGIIGVSTALFLARKNIKVALFEKGEIAGEQSGRNQGWVRISNRELCEVPLAIESARCWDEITTMVESDTGYRKCGAIYVAQTDEDLAQRAKWAEAAHDYQLGVRMLDASEAKARLPAFAWSPKGAMYSPFDGRAEPQLAAPAIATVARRLGALIFTNCAVRGLDVTNGRVAGVVTERGRVGCNGAVVAAGAWTSVFLRRYGIRLPQLKVRSSVMRVEGVDLGIEENINTSKFLLRRRLDGGYTLANMENHAADIVPDSFRYFSDFMPVIKRRIRNLPLRVGSSFFRELGYTANAMEREGGVFERYRGIEPVPNISRNLETVREMKATIPGTAAMRVDQHWAGQVDVMPDEVPVISKTDALAGLVISTGYSGHGFGIGPGAGRLTANLVSGQTPVVDPHPFRLERFA